MRHNGDIVYTKLRQCFQVLLKRSPTWINQMLICCGLNNWKEGQRKGFSVHFWGFLGKNERKMLRFLINVLNIFHLIYLKLSLTILKKDGERKDSLIS